MFRDYSPMISVVDNFLVDPDGIRAFALQQEYHADMRYFRGQRSTSAHLWPGLKEHFANLLGRKITMWEDHPTNGVFQFCVGGDQLVYHSDENTHAAIIYLTPKAPPESGTVLYRSKANKARTVNEAMRSYEGAKASPDPEEVAKLMYGGKLLDRTAWEQVDVIGNVYNRLAIWDARLVHAAGEYFGTYKEDGRLFQMFFFNCD